MSIRINVSTLPTLYSQREQLPSATEAVRNVLRPLWRPMLATLLVLWLARLGLAIWLAPRVQEAGAWSHLWWQGLRFDAVWLGLIWALPAAITPWMARHPTSWRVWIQLLRLYGGAVLLFVAFMELSTPAFIAQYDSRPNYLFVEYLGHVQELAGTLIKDQWLDLLVAAVVLPTVGLVYAKATRPTSTVTTLRLPISMVLSLVLFGALALAGRGTLGHRPANPALAAVTPDHLVNELPLSSAYTLLYALHLSRKNEDGGITYGHLPEKQVIQRVRAETGLPLAVFTDPAVPMRHRQVSLHPAPRPRNLVIVLEESLGAEFVGALGGLPLTPNLDRLAQEGLWFDQLYATGTRSVRGIEAVVAGYPPTSSVSTVKLAKSQRDFFTLARFLKGQDYTSTFFYGGESHFDNMRGFFMGNGFDQVQDQHDMPDTAFMATWGASDGDVMDRAHQHFLAQPADKPFFGLIFTSSNHAPFEFPDGQIELYDAPQATVNNAVKYADHALGRFIEQAKASPYWANTLFLVVADHNSRVYGQSLIPIERFHIPGLILGGPIERPQRISTVASQIDLAPTLISLMGLSGEHPLIGRDLSDPAQQARAGRAILQFDKVQAYMEGAQVVVMQPDTPAKLMRYADGTLSEATADNAPLVEKALAHSQYAQMAYRERWHR
ncbi:MAG: sulfatase [Betaproteobacteria bacterium HGW-Betaproteobacteria-16]|nr:MAG: sulfatase [Betaproteobacteria bacterium HGW-Betaproteobacteria-16]